MWQAYRDSKIGELHVGSWRVPQTVEILKVIAVRK